MANELGRRYLFDNSRAFAVNIRSLRVEVGACTYAIKVLPDPIGPESHRQPVDKCLHDGCSLCTLSKNHVVVPSHLRYLMAEYTRSGS
jgi:hypothetical protein